MLDAAIKMRRVSVATNISHSSNLSGAETAVETTHLVASDLVQRSRPSVQRHDVLLKGGVQVVLRPLVRTAIGQLNEGV